MSVYFMWNQDTDHIKIGHTDYLKGRLSAIQSLNSSRISIVYILPGDRREERELHDLFEKDHVRGEWFHCSANMKNFWRVHKEKALKEINYLISICVHSGDLPGLSFCFCIKHIIESHRSILEYCL